MSEKSILKRFEELPEIIESSIQMDIANSPIKIFEGIFIIKIEDEEIEVDGSVEYEWFPSKGVTFTVRSSPEVVRLSNLILEKESCEIIIDNLHAGDGLITQTYLGMSNEKPILKGIVFSHFVYGDGSISVNRVEFSVPNLREFYGAIVRTNSGTHTNRIMLEYDDYTFILDKNLGYKALKESLHLNGGYILQYSGQLTSKSGSMLLKNIEEPLHCFSTFLNFINGRRTSALFVSGFFDNEEIWTDYSHYSVDSYIYVNSWTVELKPNFADIWKNFNELWSDEDDKDFLISAIHWYVEANGNSGYIEGSIIMAQTALELLYNWWIVEDKKLILGRDSENISASNKIRLLLSQLNISPSVPDLFCDLGGLIGKDNVADAPDAIVLIRNSIVHSQKDKRKKLSEISVNAKSNALSLSIWYIEMALLRILDYKGEYTNRCEGFKDMFVPWVNSQ